MKKTVKTVVNVVTLIVVAYCLFFAFDPGIEPRQDGSDARSVAQGVR